jgi:hypothetical protein
MALIASALRYGIRQSSLSDSVRLSRFLKTPLSSGSSQSFVLAPKMLRHTLNLDGLRGRGRFPFLHPLHGSIFCGSFGLNPSPFVQ